MASLKIQNRYLLGLASWLNEQALAGRESRERSRFVTIVADQLAVVEKERKDIIDKYAEKEEDGTTLIWGNCTHDDKTTYGMGYPVALAHTQLGSGSPFGRELREAEAAASARVVSRRAR